MGRHSAVTTAGSGRVWAGRGVLLAAGVSSVMGAGAGLAAATPSLNDAGVGSVAITDEYEGPSLPDAPSGSDAPNLDGASLDRDSLNGESLRGEVSGSGMEGEMEVSDEGAAASGGVGDGSVHGSMSKDGGHLTASAPDGAPDELDELG